MDCRPLLEDPVEAGEAAKKTARPVVTFEWVCETMITNSLLYITDWIQFNLFDIKRMAPSQATDARVLLRVMLWFSLVAAAAAVLALRKPAAAGRRGVRLALALVSLASTAGTHYNKVLLYILNFDAITADADGFLFLLRFCYFVVAGVAIMLAVLDLLALVFLLRWVGSKEEK